MTQPLKCFIDEDSLDFALRHVMDYYDTDFFPRTEEFIALAHSWEEVKAYILGSDLDDILSATPLVEPWPKSYGGFRIVHRPEPIDTLIYTAFAKTVADEIEEARANPEVACSYRISVNGSGFFEHGSGFGVYRQRNESLAENYSHVFSTDISDFYNKIYLHRLQGAIQSVTDDPPGISKRIEYFLTKLNSDASQGIPVGPAASILMAEAVLIDVDQFISERGFEHTRYVDDFQIFSTSSEKLETLWQELSVYLHENHRLALSTEKSVIRTSSDFLENVLNNQYQLQKLEIFKEIEVVNPYNMEVDYDLELVENADEILIDALGKILGFEALDLGLFRSIVRRAKAHSIKGIAVALMDNLEFFAPGANDIFIYLHSISDEDFLKENKEVLVKLHEHAAVSRRAIRIWLEWYYARHDFLLKDAGVRAFLYSSKTLRAPAQAAVKLNNQSWIKERKNKLLNYGFWDRRSVILAAQVLAKDERDKWLKPLVKAKKLYPLECWIAKWVMAGCPDAEPPDLEDNIPF